MNDPVGILLLNIDNLQQLDNIVKQPELGRYDW